MKLLKWFGNSSFNFSSNPVTRMDCSLTAFDFTVQFFLYLKWMSIYSSSFFRHQIHCGHLFLLQNVKIKQFINFRLSVEDRKTFKIFV